MDIEVDVPLAARTTLGVGGPAARLTTVTTLDELRDALADAARADERVLVLGGGSNLVVSDAGWPGLVIHIGLGGVSYATDGDHVRVTAGAGVSWDAFVAEIVDAGLVGIECLAGIPGLVGATPIQNVGAYGQEVADTLVTVRVLDRTTGEVVTIDRDACGFAYRTSVFKGSERWIVLDVQFRLGRDTAGAPIRYGELARSLEISEGDRAPLADVRRTVIELRRGKGMVLDPGDPESRSAGSFFMNPIVDAATLALIRSRLAAGVVMPAFPQPDGSTKLSAGWLIEQSGFAKGFTIGRVGISRKHALALVNRGGATARELLELARMIVAGVHARWGVWLVPEPVVV
ncbi:MAG: UDP-N-acetylmuramate dehydrogenase [Kofleriaceae bacterium]